MEGNDRAKDAPSLEPPSLFGRKRRRRERPDATGATPAEPPTRVEPPASVEPPAPVEPPARVAPPAPVEPARAAEPAEPPLFADEVPVEEDAATVAAAEEPLTVAGRPPRRQRAARTREPAEAEGRRSPRLRAAALPRRVTGVNGTVAACLTGLVVGLGTVLLTWASLGLCDVATGTPSCGDPGFILLAAVLIAMTLLGSAMLRLFGIADAGSTSFLAVGILAVLILLFLVEVLFSWAMVVVIPLLAVGTYALSHWVTTISTETD